MSVYVGPGEGVEGEGCRPSIYIYIDICTGTWVYFFPYLDIAYSYLCTVMLFSHSVYIRIYTYISLCLADL